MQPQHPDGSPLSGHPDSSHLDALPVAALAVDRAGSVTYANGAALELLGRSRDELVDRDLLTVAFGPADRGAAQEVLAQVLRGETWSGDLPIVAGDETSAAQVSGTALRLGDEVRGALIVLQKIGVGSARRREAARVGDRLTRLARVAAELVLAEGREAVTKIVINHAADAAGATVASLALRVDPDTMELQGIRGGLEGAERRWARFSVHANTPGGEAVRTGRQLLLVGLDEIRARYPDLESAASGERTMICLPLKVTGHTIGVISLSFPGIRRLDTAEMEFLGILADICAQALDRMQAIADSAAQAAKLEFLAHASVELNSSLDYHATLRNVARLAVPTFADWCAIAVVEDGDLHTLAVAHQDPQKVAMAEELQQKYPSDPDSTQGAHHVARTGASLLVPEITDEMLVASTTDEEHLRLARELNLKSAILVPLKVRDSVRGVITWVAGEGDRRFGPDDLTFAEHLARRSAIAIDNAQLHSETLQAAVRLQRAVLPESLPSMPGWSIAAHYSPAGRTEVGGDFYDVVLLPDGRVAMFVGDVMGRGVVAAAAMAQMRAAIRAYLAVDPEPGMVMQKLDQMFLTYDFTQLVTLIYLVLDPAREELTAINAGHPPPVVLREDGTVEQLPSTGDGPLGVNVPTRTPLVVGFSDGDTLLMFTDGLIERRTEDIDAGQLRVVEAAPLLRSPDLFAALDLLVETVRDHTSDDDVAAVVARWTRSGS